VCVFPNGYSNNKFVTMLATLVLKAVYLRGYPEDVRQHGEGPRDRDCVVDSNFKAEGVLDRSESVHRCLLCYTVENSSVEVRI
jgi:hypothetical protein